MAADGHLALVVTSLTLTGYNGPTPSRLELNDNALIDNWTGGSQLTTLRDYIVSGFNGDSWNGGGISSSAAASKPGTGIGYATAAQLGSPATFAGIPIDNTADLAIFTLLGDANLDRTVDTIDFNLLASSFSKASALWFNGDFNYDSSVNTIDFNLLASNFGKSMSGEVGALAVIPEPGALFHFFASLSAFRSVRRPKRR